MTRIILILGDTSTGGPYLFIVLFYVKICCIFSFTFSELMECVEEFINFEYIDSDVFR